MQEGYSIEGVDPYFRPNHKVPSLTEKIRIKSLAEARFQNYHFSAVMLWSVLEHIAEPAPLLEEISRITASGGRLVISVPNLNTFQHKLVKQYWPGFGPPEHLVVYSVDGLAKLMEKFGFQVERKFSDLVYDQWMLKNSFYQFLISKSKSRNNTAQLSKNFNKVERSIVSLFVYLIVRMESLMEKSSTANIVFRKR